MSSEAKPDSGKDAYTRDKMQDIAHSVDEQLPQDWGFIVFAFPLNHPGRLNYVSNAQRADVLKALREFIARNEQQDIMARHVE